jgi:2,4-dienoyl-CoA reductase-like NADH-dependent reductase (Old Yellow Enzyme family)
MSDEDGSPLPQVKALYEKLAQGGVGLIITGHMFIHPTGKANHEMTAVYDDRFIPGLADLTQTVHQAGGKLVAQINHGGMQCNPQVIAEAIAPSTFQAEFIQQPAREMTLAEIETMIDAFGLAARRVKEAGFDGVQIHSAHGYLNSEFLSPLTNTRTDHWGGSLENRMRFLHNVCKTVRTQVGAAYPVLIKLGIMDGVEGGLSAEEGAQVAARLADWGLDAIEISGGIGGSRSFNTRTGIRSSSDEAYFRPLARQVKALTHLPVALVGGFRSKAVMEDVLNSGDAEFISLCRPLICEPDFPNRLRSGIQDRSRCLSANLCYPTDVGQGIACRCKLL